MGRIVPVGDELHPVERCRCSDPIRNLAGQVHGERPAHAVSDDPDSGRIGCVVVVGVGDQRPPIPDDRFVREVAHQFAHPVPVAGLEHVELGDIAVVEVGRHHVVPGGGQPTRHVADLLAHARGVHQEQHQRVRAVLLRMYDEGVHVAVSGVDVDEALDHRASLTFARPACRVGPVKLIMGGSISGGVRCASRPRP